MDSILDTIKKKLGIDPSYTAFDEDIRTAINSTFMILNQLGVGPETPFRITGNSETWDDFSVSIINYELVKDYIYLKVRKIFDPPTGAAAEASDNLINEFEWRLNVAVDPED
jgi:hypothetical protein